jgi:hypothetical protein
MDQSTKHAIELCQRVLTNPARKDRPHWGDDFIAHQCEVHPEIREALAKLAPDPRSAKPH